MGITREEAFEVLELPFGADQDSVRTSYKRLALKWHPDKHENSAQSTQKFQRISKAYKRLTDDDDDEEITMSMSDMFDLFQQIFFARAMGAFNGYGGYGYDSYEDEDDDDDDYDDDDEDNVDYLSIFADKLRTKQDYRKSKIDNLGTTKRFLTPEEIEKNAHELISEEEKEKRKAEKRRAKKKRRREKKKLEKQESDQQKKETLQKNNQKQRETIIDNENQKSSKKDKKSKDSSQSEEEDFDQTAAFFTKVISKKKKGTTVPESQPNNHGNKSSKTKEKLQKQTQQLSQQQNGKVEEESEDLDPVVLRSRQLAIRGNEMANSGHYNPAIELFTEAIKLDPSDFRFFGNRSYCFDRNQQYEKALRDAEKAVSLSPEWPKGYFRKGRALAGLKLYADAEQAFMQVLKLDRQCEDAMQELLRVRTHQLTEMGFSKQQAESATRQFGTVQQALDSLLSGVVTENSLASEVYVSDDDEHSGGVNNNHNLAGHSLPAPNLPLRTAIGGATVKMDPKNPEGLTALWVGNVLPEVSDKKLMTMFSKYGPVTSVRLLPEKFCAFVNYKSKEGAGKAMAKLQGAECCGQRLLIKFPDNPITNGNVVIKKQPATTLPATTTTTTVSSNKIPKLTQPTASSITPGALVTDTLDKQSGPVNGDECYFWRTTGCLYGNKCRWKHRPDHKGIDRKPWQKVK